jgi:YidC/Oxa1 family membrane protein insertase
MDNKNVFVAIALSMSVLLFWGAFFETPEKVNQDLKTKNQIQKKTDNSLTPSTNQAPSINQINIKKKLSREESINKSNRIKIENENIIGSISLIGGLIDDISFKNHNQKMDFMLSPGGQVLEIISKCRQKTPSGQLKEIKH